MDPSTYPMTETTRKLYRLVGEAKVILRCRDTGAITDRMLNEEAIEILMKLATVKEDSND